MEKSNYSLFEEVLKRINEYGLHEHLVIVGSWSIYLYSEYFKSEAYLPTIRTRDIDLLVLIPDRIPAKVNFKEIIDDIGFIEELVGDEGYTRYSHPELIIEFLVQEKGRGSSKPRHIEKLGVTPQPLRFLNLLESGKIKLTFKGMSVLVPHPANFALHKLLIASRRREVYKSDMDRRQGFKLINDLIDHGEVGTLRSVFNSIPKSWQRVIRNELITLGQDEILKRIEESFRERTGN